MTDQAASNGEVRLMRELIDELRAETPPELDWIEVERRLTARVAQRAAWRRAWRSDSGAIGALRRASVLAAAAAAVALMVASGGSDGAALSGPADAGLARPAPEGESSRSAASWVGPGVVVTTDAIAQEVKVEGLGTWRLEPNGAAAVRRTAGPYVVALERGTILVEVTPTPDSDDMVESFVVEVGHTRVAVHGTVFSVTRLDDSVRVEALRGTVAVGPAGHRGLTIGRLLVAPATAEFSLDGGREARLLPGPSPEAVAAAGALHHEGQRPTTMGWADAVPIAAGGPAAEPSTGELAVNHRPQPSTAGPAGAENEPPVSAPDHGPEEPAPPPPQPPPAPLTANEARALIAGCLAATEEGSGGTGVRVTISTRVTLHRTPDDRVGSVQFNPPLRPDLQQRCAGPLLGRTLAGAGGAVSVSVVVAPR